MINLDYARECVAKSAEVVVRQKHFVEQLKTEGFDSSEAEGMLVWFVSAHLTFAKRLRAALAEGNEADISSV